MTIDHRIVIAPTLDKDGKHRRTSQGPLFDASYEGKQVVSGSTEPFLDGARALKAMGLSGRIEMWDGSTPYARMTADIDKAAGLTIREGNNPPYFVKFNPVIRVFALDGDLAPGGPTACR